MMHTLRNLKYQKVALILFNLQIKLSVSHTALFHFLLFISSKVYQKGLNIKGIYIKGIPELAARIRRVPQNSSKSLTIKK